MSDLEKDITRLREQVTLLQMERETVERASRHDRKLLALLLQAACGYRDAHAVMRHDVRQDVRQDPWVFQGRPPREVEARLLEVYSAQTILFAAIDLVQEEKSQRPEEILRESAAWEQPK